MPKGMFTQAVCLLTDGRTGIDDLRTALEAKDFEIVKQIPAMDDWRFGGPTLIVSYLPEVNGYVAVDVVNQIWPDGMGDPKKDPMTFGAWTMGQFGPFTFPGGLARAAQHAWAWPDGRTVAPAQRGFVRCRLSYAFGAGDDDPIWPKDYDPLAELLFLSRLTLAIFKAPGVLCYFNPNGEVLRDRAGFRELWNECRKQDKIPLDLWMNVRFFKLSERLGFMDTVGNGQLDLDDVEAVYPTAKYEPGVIDYYLRNVTYYLLGLDRPLKTGEAIDGPGESNLSWLIEAVERGAIDAPRRTIRLYPKALRQEVQQALAGLGVKPADEAPAKKTWLK